MPVVNFIFLRSSSWPSFRAFFMTFIFSLGPVSYAWATNPSHRMIASAPVGPTTMGDSNSFNPPVQMMMQADWIPHKDVAFLGKAPDPKVLELYEKYNDAHFGSGYLGGLSSEEVHQKLEEAEEKLAVYNQSLREILDNKTSRQEEVGKIAENFVATEIYDRLDRLRWIEDTRKSEKDEVQPKDIQERKDRLYHLAVKKIMDELSSLREQMGPHFQKQLDRLQKSAGSIDEGCINNELLIAAQKNSNKSTEGSAAFNNDRQSHGAKASKPGGLFATGLKGAAAETQDIRETISEMTAMAKEVKTMNAKCQKKFKDFKGYKLLKRALRGNYELPDFDDGKNSANANSSTSTSKNFKRYFEVLLRYSLPPLFSQVPSYKLDYVTFTFDLGRSLAKLVPQGAIHVENKSFLTFFGMRMPRGWNYQSSGR